MEAKIEAFNWDLKWFLSNLATFRKHVNTSNEITMGLLSEILDAIDDFVGNVRRPEKTASSEIIDWLAINEDLFEYHRSFFCRVCKRSFPADRHEYIFHVASDKHNFAVVKYNNLCARLSPNASIPQDKGLDGPDAHNNNIESKAMLPQGSDNLVNVCELPMETKPLPVTLKQNTFDNDIVRLISSMCVINECRPTSSNIRRNITSSVLSNPPSNGAIVKKPEIKSPNTTNERVANKSFFEGDLVSLLNYAISTSSIITQTPAHVVISIDIKKLLKDKFKSFESYLIGSRIIGTTIDNNASLDIYLDLDKSFSNDKSGAIFVENILTVRGLIEGKGEWSNVKLTEQSRYGILSAMHNSTKTNCNFIFGTGVFARNHDLVKCLFNVQQVCRHLVLCIRMSMENINEPKWTRKFSGYIVSLLVIFYFQSTKRLPSVKSLQENCVPQQCGENNVAFNRPANITICKDRLSVLLTGFFDFYSKFDFTKNIISVYEGCPISHSIREADERSLSHSVLRFRRITTSLDTWKSSKMCTQDVLMHKQNVTQSIDSKNIKQFQEYCSKSLAVLRSSGSLIRY